MSEGVACPVCGEFESKVLDCRPVHSEGTFRRRRLCPNGHKYSTKEMLSVEYNAIKHNPKLPNKIVIEVDMRLGTTRIKEG